ncbi:hypothetical protein L484_012165 [Morus notabilis]|uniref:Uncharacterized protein n=1 Tax=Morus notabilis TaxID=981085 RepID=W9RI06_9ROSA|nr:uncharacterized protein LOC21395394 [Morus notabilis]EXB75041.1 hypothetical protein L484_012165 [Morus notabilis]
MEPNIDDHHQYYPSELSSSSSSSSCSSSKDPEIRAVELLEDYWFFGNLLINTNKPRNNMFVRWYSDPCPSSNTCQEAPVVNGTESSSKTPVEGGGIRRDKLVRTPSLQPNIVREEGRGGHERRHRESDYKAMKQKVQVHEREIRSCSRSKSNTNSQQPPRNNLLTRAQTLPPLTSIRKVEMNQDHHDQETTNEKIMTKSSLQASLNLADILPPRHNKGSSRYRSPRTAGLLEDINTDGSKEMRRRYFKGRNLGRSLSELEIEEVQGFKDLGFKFDNKDLLSPNVVNILPGLQERKEEDMGLQNKVRRPYLSEAWMAQSAPPTPNWAASRSSQEMKAQIKFWARSVASNVRQEC